MTKAAVDQVVRRAIGDAAFRRQLHSDPDGALAGFQLTKDERSAITSGDPKRLTALGVDQRMSKAFDLGGQGVVSKMISPDTSGTTAKAFIDEGSRTTKALIDEGTAGGTGSAVTIGEGGSLNAMNLRRIEGDLNTASAREPVDVSGDFNALDPGIVSSTTSARDAGTSINASNLRRIEGDLNTASAREPVDVSGDFNALDPGIVSGTTSAADAGALNTAASAFEPQSAAGDFNTLDEGYVSGSDTATAPLTDTTHAADANVVDAGDNRITE